MVYQWKWSMPVAAQAAGEHLEKLESQNGGLTPKVVLEDSRDEKALLHPCFEWDDAAAAELYRESQARFLLRNLVVKVERKEENADAPPRRVRAFVSVETDNDNSARVYTSISRAFSEMEMRERVLRDAWEDMQAFREKYRAYTELSGVISEIDKLIEGATA